MVLSGFADARSIEALLEKQRAALDKVASGVPLAESLSSVVEMVEGFAGLSCAVLLKGEGEPRSDIGASSGLRATWSTPVLSSANEVLGTFAVYRKELHPPTERDVRLIAMATQIARIAIEARRDAPLLGYRLGRTLVTDLVGTLVRVEDAFIEALGYPATELLGQNISTVAPWDDHDALVARLLAPGGWNDRGSRRYRSRDGRTLVGMERRAVLRDGADRARLIISLLESVIEADKHPLNRLSQREREVLELVVAGRTSRDIATCLRIAEPSVATYRSRIMTKLGLENMAGLVHFAIDNGLYRSAA